MMNYIKLTSFTFWSGILAIVVGLSMMLGLGDQESLGRVAQIISALQGAGDASPAALIALGGGLIGIRRRLD